MGSVAADNFFFHFMITSFTILTSPGTLLPGFPGKLLQHAFRDGGGRESVRKGEGGGRKSVRKGEGGGKV